MLAGPLSGAISSKLSSVVGSTASGVAATVVSSAVTGGVLGAGSAFISNGNPWQEFLNGMRSGAISGAISAAVPLVTNAINKPKPSVPQEDEPATVKQEATAKTEQANPQNGKSYKYSVVADRFEGHTVSDLPPATFDRGSFDGGAKGGIYIPKTSLAQQKVAGWDIPLPDPLAGKYAHTTLGGKMGSDGIFYRQSATFTGGSWPLANGKIVPWSRVDWSAHGRPLVHPNPHQHFYF